MQAWDALEDIVRKRLVPRRRASVLLRLQARRRLQLQLRVRVRIRVRAMVGLRVVVRHFSALELYASRRTVALAVNTSGGRSRCERGKRQRRRSSEVGIAR